MNKRSFIGKLWTGLTAIGAASLLTPAAQAQSTNKNWQPARHDLDDWYDQIPGKHRLVFDTVDPNGFASAMTYGNTFYRANDEGYGLKADDLAVIFIARARSTAFGYNDAIWARYGETLSQRMNITDPRTKQPAKVNIHLKGADDSGEGVSLETFIKRGLHFAVCRQATRGNATAIAKAINGNADSIFEELAANLIPNAHLVPAGIVAVNRAQEHGYSFVRG
jgi:intracellular sulfur oxidation DsrE/DsrF family protein